MTARPWPPNVAFVPIGRVRGGRVEPIDDDWGDTVSDIVLEDRFPSDALDGLGDFSHVDVVYVFDLVDESLITVGARHPRGRTDWPSVGIFAQRARARPNRIGVTTCEVLAVTDRTVTVRGLDAVDGTPVLDLKPYMAEFAPRGRVRQPGWSRELMQNYWTGARAEPDPDARTDVIEVVRLVPDDARRALAAFTMMHDVFDEDPAPLSLDYVTRLLRDDSFWAIAAFEDDEPIGCITAHEMAMTRHERTELFIYDLAVRVDRQRRGIGRRVVERLLADADDRRIGVVFVPADDDDAHALAFYERIGGRPAKVTMFDLGSE